MPTTTIPNRKRSVEQAAKPWIERVARCGFGAKGVVYIVVGVLATQAALGRGGSLTDSRGALHTIAARPSGAGLLSVVALGLVAYAMWRFLEAWKDPEGKGSDATGLITRASYVCIGVFYVGLAFTAVRIVQRQRTDVGGQVEESWTARLLAQPLGRWLIGSIGVGIIGFFLYQLYGALTGTFPEQLRVGDLSGEEDTWAMRLGGFGLAARGVVFGLIGLFLIQAALQHNPDQVGGLDEALQALARQGQGRLLLGVVAVGLVAYGSYMLLIAWYRRRFIM